MERHLEIILTACEIASYGCLHEWAEHLDNEKAARLLQEILDEEKAANEARVGSCD